MNWRLAKSLESLRREVLVRYPGTTIWTVGDADHRSRPSDHNPHDHDDDPRTAEVVSAIDVVGHAQARALWDHLRTTKDDRVEYMIFNGHWTGADHGWRIRTYTGRNQHRNHTHVSVGRGTDRKVTRPDLYDDASPWGFADTKEDEMEIVANIQRSLIAAGYDLGDFEPYADGYPRGADGDWGSKTEAAFVNALKGGSGVTESQVRTIARGLVNSHAANPDAHHD